MKGSQRAGSEFKALRNPGSGPFHGLTPVLAVDAYRFHPMAVLADHVRVESVNFIENRGPGWHFEY